MMSLISNDCFMIGASFMNGGHGYGFASSVGHLRSDSVRLLVYNVMHTIYVALVFYYKSLDTTPTLPGMN
jgi:hypothetical protein